MAEGEVQLGGSPSLYVEGNANWVTVSWEDPDTGERNLLGGGVPEAIASTLADYLKGMPERGRHDPAEWVLSLEDPPRALFARFGDSADELALFWQEAGGGTLTLHQTAPIAEVEAWCKALDLFGSADPDDVVRPDRRDL